MGVSHWTTGSNAFEDISAAIAAMMKRRCAATHELSRVEITKNQFTRMCACGKVRGPTITYPGEARPGA